MPRSPSPYQVRPGTDDDIPAVIELMRLSLGEGTIPRTRDFWTWKHRANPFGSSPMWLATVGTDVVGVRLFMRWSFAWAGGRSRASAVRAVDTATHPEWQGKGIFKRLTLGLVDEVSTAGVGFVFNTPNEKSRPGYLKMGWQQVGRVSLWVKPNRPLNALRKLVQASSIEGAPEDGTSQSSSNDSDDQILKAAEGAELLRRTTSRKAGYFTPLSDSYLRWRYLACPAARYQLSAPDPQRALVVYRRRQRRGMSELTISDLIVEPSISGIRAATAALRAALAEARADYVVAAFRRDAWEAAALVACGFVPAPRLGPILTVRTLTPSADAPDVLSLTSFQTSIGDLELF